MYEENNNRNLNFTQQTYGIKMSDAEFSKLSKFITDSYGIKLPDNKRIMVQSRLLKRIRHLNMTSFSSYFDLVFRQRNAQEMINMVDAITTNKTDFFREPVHFSYMREVILPEYVNNAGSHHPFNVWSAACSTGEEPYTIAMSLSEFAQTHRSLNYRILATDLSTEVLLKAKAGVYQKQKAEEVPAGLRNKYMEKSISDPINSLQVKASLKTNITFKRLNFLDKYYPVQGEFDLIFCRNVLIYFERSVQEMVINNLCRFLPKGGYLFLGHSESILGMNVPLQQIRPTIYTKI